MAQRGGADLEAFSITDIGKHRSANEDFVFCSMEPIGHLPNLFIVADGMGGHKAGQYASRFCVEYFTQHVQDTKASSPISIIKKALEETNAKLIELSQGTSDFEGMGTTFVVATIVDETMYVANVGDSRLYVVGDQLQQVTEDHSLVEIMIKSGEIDREEARSHPNKNIITRALGADLSVKADYFEVNLNDINTILMCTDGLTNMVNDSNINHIIINSVNIKEAAHSLIKTANDNGGIDNIGIIIINVKKR